MNEQYQPPDHLSAEATAWCRGVNEDFVLAEHHVLLLHLAAESWDRCAAARRAIDEHGPTYVDRFGAPRARPEISIERDSRLAFSRILRELDLDISHPSTPESKGA